ncbi:MAG TPA: DEAD/DEAH box helicase [Candidatus Hydrogenedentes bacterium]|nr:DEAD/DEAH box helicase [Candidatus Hydrogenedentota bacterium]
MSDIEQIGQQADVRIGAAALERMRREIIEAGGREVFFAGALNGDGVVERARVCSRGTEDAVPAIFEALEVGAVVVHNHPGGDIGPSEADLELASIFGHHGHGVYIVDNDVARVYVVVEPFLEKNKHKLSPTDLAETLRPNSPMARFLPEFEVRPQQAQMMAAVAEAFNHDGIAVIEAPTGIGKTVAYLVPAIAWAVRNRERVIVSTKTINLQEQIIAKDIPLLEKCLDEKFSAVLVKGRANYLCFRKLQRALSEATLFDDENVEEALRTISEWANKTSDGSRSDLPFVPPRELWERLCSEADLCAGVQCSYAKKCFLNKARRQIAKADIVVANHHILFSDMAIKKEIGSFTSLAVLPAYKRVIFDEAHNIEDSATEYFGSRVTRGGALALLGRFVNAERGKERGLLPFITRKLVQKALAASLAEIEQIQDLIHNSLMPAIAAARESLIAVFSAIRSLASEKCGEIGRDVKWRLTEQILQDPELREIHKVYALPAVEDVMACAKQCNALHKRLKAIKPNPGESELPFLTELAQLRGYEGRLRALANGLAEGTSADLKPNTVRWIEIDAHRSTICRIATCPLEVGKPLAEWVYPNLKTIVMTSATLAVQRSFEYLFSRIGLDRLADREVAAVALDTPFDFTQQALLCIPTDIPSPEHKAFLDASVEHIREALDITRGHAFVLFTSFYALDYAFRRLETHLKQHGIASMKQGSAPRTHLLERFRSDPSSVLFATDSFWEGVDVAGEALQCVILPKLPFRVPTEPVLQARAEAIDAAGGNSFMAYTVPQAVIKFRQGIGRLIRRKSDRGAVVVLDRRVVMRYYGRAFLESLPELHTVKGPGQRVYDALRGFFAGDGEGEP